MIHSSKGLALMLSLAIGLSTSLLYFFLGNPAFRSVLLFFVIASGICFILIYLVMESFVFSEIRDIPEKLHGFADTDENVDEIVDAAGKNTVAGIREQVLAFAKKKQTEVDRLQKLEVFRKDLIADISHELKTPIFAAQGFVHTLLDGALREKAVRKKFLKKAARSLDGLDLLVQDLLTLSQIETGEIKMHVVETDLYPLTLEVFDQFRGKSNKKKIALRIEGPVRKVMVFADSQRIFQVMTNLISNAIKHSAAKEEVVVSFAIRKRSVVTRVEDFGEGISKEHIHRIFERFYRVDKSRSREKGGTGLGLAIVKHILEGHNSKPKVESEPGKGSIFSFRLPRVNPEPKEHGTDHEPSED